MWSNRHLGRPTVALVAAVCAVVLSACGSSGSSRPDPSKLQADGIRLADCMRAHGVPNFPDPTTSGDGISIRITPGSGIDPRSPAFRSAQAACHQRLPGGGPGAGGPPSAQVVAQLRAISTCMRARGITDFPDPTTTQPNGGDFGLVMGRGWAFLAIPNSIDTASPAFEQAAKACHFGP